MSCKTTVHRFEFYDNVLEVEEYPFGPNNEYNITMDYAKHQEIKATGWKVGEDEFRLLVYNDDGYVRLHMPVAGFETILAYLASLKEHYDSSEQTKKGENDE